MTVLSVSGLVSHYGILDSKCQLYDDDNALAMVTFRLLVE